MQINLTEHITIDREQRSVYKDGKEVHLTGLEYGLLDFLSVHANRVCTRQELLDNVWGARFQYDAGTIDVHLNALRRKLGWGSKQPIETIRGVGLIFRINTSSVHYTIDLQRFLSDWVCSHQVELNAAGLVPQLQLTPFVNEITIAPEALGKLLDSVLEALLPTVQPGVIKLTSHLNMRHFALAIDINGTVNELRIPIRTE